MRELLPYGSQPETQTIFSEPVPELKKGVFLHEVLITADSWKEAYQQLGARVKGRVKEILFEKELTRYYDMLRVETGIPQDLRREELEAGSTPEQKLRAQMRAGERFRAELLIAKKARGKIGELARRPTLDSSKWMRNRVTQYAHEYEEILDAWASFDGAHLESVVPILSTFYDLPEELTFDGIDVAYLLQNDNFGCATLMKRMRDGSVMLLHTEEDDSGKIFEPTVVSINVNGELLTFFEYPHLLPGATFTWKKDQSGLFIQTVNYLPIAFPDNEQAMGVLANFGSWTIMRHSRLEETETLLREIGLFTDGYSANQIQIGSKGEVLALKTVFARDHVWNERLHENPDSILIQVNSLPEALIQEHPEMTWHCDDEGQSAQERIKGCARRLGRMHRMVEKCRGMFDESDASLWLAIFRRYSAFRLGGEYALSNPSQLASAIMYVGPMGAEIRVIPGQSYRTTAGNTFASYRVDQKRMKD